MILKLFILFIFVVLIYSIEKFTDLFDPSLPPKFSIPPDIITYRLIKVNTSYSCPPNTMLNTNNLCVPKIVPKCPKSATVIDGKCFFTDLTSNFICPENFTITNDNNTCLDNNSTNSISSFCPDGYGVVNGICTKYAGIPLCLNDECTEDPSIPFTFYNCPPKKKLLGGICQ
jgi:hypothetical protein